MFQVFALILFVALVLFVFFEKRVPAVVASPELRT